MIQSPNTLLATAGEVATETATAAGPAGAIQLVRRNRACARTRVLAGLALGSGLVVTLGSITTSVSVPA